MHLAACRDRVVRTLLDLSRHDSDDDIRSYALQSLAWHRLNGVEFDAIVELLLDGEQDDMIRENAFAVLTSTQTDAGLKKHGLKRLIGDPDFGESARIELESMA